MFFNVRQRSERTRQAKQNTCKMDMTVKNWFTCGLKFLFFSTWSRGGILYGFNYRCANFYRNSFWRQNSFHYLGQEVNNKRQKSNIAAEKARTKSQCKTIQITEHIFHNIVYFKEMLLSRLSTYLIDSNVLLSLRTCIQLWLSNFDRVFVDDSTWFERCSYDVKNQFSDDVM